MCSIYTKRFRINCVEIQEHIHIEYFLQLSTIRKLKYVGFIWRILRILTCRVTTNVFKNHPPYYTSYCLTTYLQ